MAKSAKSKKSAAAGGKASVEEVMRKAADPGTSKATLRKYFVLDERHSGPFSPQLRLNPDTVDVPDTPEGRARGAMAINIANSTARLRRTLAFNRKIASGYDGPVIVSEGDSWFQFPILIDETIDHLLAKGYAIRSLDAAGDTLANMIKDREYALALVRTGATVFLFSAGGNDVLGNGALADHLMNFDPARSPADHILPSYQTLLDEAIAGYDKVLRTVEALPGDILILCHGYDHPVPNRGKWLGKPMEERDIKDKAFQKRITDELVDRFNARLKALVAGFPNARYIDMRGKVGPNPNKWHDELHPTSNGYKAIANAFAELLPKTKQLPKPAPHKTKSQVARQVETAKPSAARQGISLHVGLNHIDPVHYGTDGALNACIADAEAMESLAKASGYTVSGVLTDEKATREAVKSRIAEAAKTLKAGDIFLYTYSGHGSQAPDFNQDEKDSIDETWCLYDGMLIDDEAYELWLKFAEGVRVFVLLDCCHSGSAIKALPFGAGLATGAPVGAPFQIRKPRFLSPAIARKVVLAHEDFYRKIAKSAAKGEGAFESAEDIVTRPQRAGLRCTVRLISGCQDEQLSLDGSENGRFTEELLNVWNNGSFDGSYRAFHEKIVRGIAADGPQAQTPNHMVIGVHNEAFDAQKPFTI